MKFHVTMQRSVELMRIICTKFSPDGYSVQILGARTHHRKGSAYMTVTFEGRDDLMTKHVVGEIERVTGIERVVRDDYVEPPPPDFAQCQGFINITPFSETTLIGRCRSKPVWLARNKKIDKKKRVTLC